MFYCAAQLLGAVAGVALARWCCKARRRTKRSGTYALHCRQFPRCDLHRFRISLIGMRTSPARTFGPALYGSAFHLFHCAPHAGGG